MATPIANPWDTESVIGVTTALRTKLMHCPAHLVEGDVRTYRQVVKAIALCDDILKLCDEQELDIASEAHATVLVNTCVELGIPEPYFHNFYYTFPETY